MRQSGDQDDHRIRDSRPNTQFKHNKGLRQGCSGSGAQRGAQWHWNTGSRASRLCHRCRRPRRPCGGPPQLPAASSPQAYPPPAPPCVPAHVRFISASDAWHLMGHAYVGAAGDKRKRTRAFIGVHLEANWSRANCNQSGSIASGHISPVTRHAPLAHLPFATRGMLEQQPAHAHNCTCSCVHTASPALTRTLTILSSDPTDPTSYAHPTSPSHTL